MMRPLTLPSRLARTSCSVLALATVLVVGATPAAAQSFLGTGTATNGPATTITTGVNTTNITVTTPQTVIDWVPFDTVIAPNTTIAFQNSGTTASFSGTGNYAVLNRINPADSTRSITMNGTIQTIALGFAGASNGSIYFYTPGGFVIGANAVINVGSLVMSASPITVTAGNFINGASNTVVFGQANPSAAIVTNALSQITASAGDAYVAMVAPRVQHSGNINVNGSAALVGAEAATINFSPDGLFDIQVTTGTTDANGVFTNGNITGSASAGAGDARRAFLVAVPKNTALTMAMTIGSGADLGFAIAGAANVSGNAVILSAGHDIVDGEIGGVSAGSVPGSLANLISTGLNATSGVRAVATNFAEFYAGSGQANSFASDLNIRAPGRAWVNATGTGTSLTIVRDLVLNSDRVATTAAGSATGGFAALYTNINGAITVGRDATLTANGTGNHSSTAGIAGGIGTGGNAVIQNQATGGTISIGRNATVSANAIGGNGLVAGANGGAGTGGFATIRSFASGTSLTIGGTATAQAYGMGGSALGCVGCLGGAGTGGTAWVYGGIGTTSMTLGAVAIDANGYGGFGGVGGIGRGGDSELYFGGNTVMAVTGNASIRADGWGGDSVTGNGGLGDGGKAVIGTEIGAPGTGSLTVGSVGLSAIGTGGNASALGATGGTGQGGEIDSGGSYGTLAVTGGYFGFVDGTGGSSAQGIGGSGIGGDGVFSTSDAILTVGSFYMSANGQGGLGRTGGYGEGGEVYLLSAQNLTVTGDATLIATAFGGLGQNGNGGNALGGLAYLRATNGTLTVGLDTTLNVEATGGGTDAVGSSTGDGQGGDAHVRALTGGTTDLNGQLIVDATGYGGQVSGSFVNGGDGKGGDIFVEATGPSANLSVAWMATLTANGYGNIGGECGFCAEPGQGGDGTGGNIYVTTSGASVGTGIGIDFDNLLTINANGYGGYARLGAAGDGFGGLARISIGGGGSLDVGNNLTVNAIGYGGDQPGSGLGGDATGGTAEILTVGPLAATINVTGNVVVNASAFGGDTDYGNDFPTGGTGGNALGGSAAIRSQIGTITISGNADVYSEATGGDAFNGIGGNGRGNAATALAAGGNLTINGHLGVYAMGIGGASMFGGASGDGFGGTALIQATGGSTLAVRGAYAEANADGLGGAPDYDYNYDFASGGDGTGGTARIESYATAGIGGILDIDGSAYLYARGFGGDATGSADSLGGNGIGGTAELHSSLGSINIGGEAEVSADGTGGDAPGAIGGVGIGGNLAEIAAIGGDITIEGHASVSASGFGGDGAIGGVGYGSGEYDAATQTWSGGAHIFARNGDIVINGGAEVSATGIGGDGAYDNGFNGDYGGDGGNGFGGYATIHAANSDLGPSSITIVSGALEGSGVATVNVDGVGGDGGDGANGGAGGDGGNGGYGQAGSGSIAAAAGNGTVTISNAVGYALGTGGYGGNGGSGGLGSGGYITIGTVSGTAQSTGVNNGFGDYGSITADVSGTGGDGGNGGTGAFGSPNGNGGNGGDAFGGGVNLQVRGSRVDVDVATLTADAAGGAGGIGGFGSTNGNGGNATVGSNAGPGFISGIAVLVTGRYLIPAQRGTLNAGTITGTTIATAGIGSSDGSSQNLGGSSVTFLNGDGNIDSLDILVQADDQAVGAVHESISVINGDVTIDGEFSFVTSGNLSLFLDNGDLTAGSIIWHAADFVPDTVNVTPVAPGTFFANSFDIQTGNNFITTAHLDSVQTLTINAPGAIQIGNVTGDNSIVLQALGGEIDIGNIIAGGGIDLDALAFITTGNATGNGVIDIDAGASIGMGSILNTGNTSLNAGTSINVGAINSGLGSVSLVTNNSGDISGSIVVGGSIYADSDGDIFLGNLTAPGDIELVAIGDILIGNALAGESIDMDAGGYLDGGTMTAGDSVYAEAGEYVDLLNISAGLVDQSTAEGADYNVGILAGSTIDTGDIAARNSIGLGAAGNIYTGSIDAGNIFLALGGGNMSFGTINAGQQAYLADDSMIPLGGDLTGGSYNPAAITILTPTQSGGSITLRGPVTTGRFVAAAGTTLIGTTIDSVSSIYTFSGGNTTLTDLDAGSSIFQRSGAVITENDLDAGSYIDIRATGGLALGDLVAGDYIDLRSSGAIGLLTANSGETINFQTLGTLTGLTINAGNSVLGQAVGAIQLGNISAGIIDPSSVAGAINRVGLASNSTITTGAINALGNIGFGTPQNVTTGNLTSGGGIMALIGGNASFGAISTGPNGYVYLGNHSMSPLGGAFETFNRAPILAQFPASTGGSILITGPVTTGNFRASAGTTFNAGNINSTTNILIDSGGNMTLGNLVAGLNVNDIESDSDNAIRFNSGGSIVMGNATALDGIDFDAEGSVTGGNLTSGRSVGGSANGAIVLGNLSGGIVNPQGPTDDGFSVGAESGTSITVGNVIGAESVGFATLGSITTGTINAGSDFLVMATGNMSFGTINAGGRVYLADSSMYIAAGGGDEGDGDDEFDPALVFGATPVASGGSITLGAVNAGSFQAAAGTTLTGTTINSNGLLYAASGGNMTFGNLTAGTNIDTLSGGSQSLANLTAGNRIELDSEGAIIFGIVNGRRFDFTSGGAVTGGNINALSSATGEAQGAITLGNITTTGAPPVDDFSIGFASATSILVGNASGTDRVGFATLGNLTAGNLTAGRLVMALVGGDMVTGSITSANNGRVYIADGSMYATGGGTGDGDFDSAIVLALAPVATGGSITINGPVTTGRFQAAAGDNLATRAITASVIEGYAGGTAGIDGIWTAGSTFLASNDINITTNGRIDGGTNGEITLNSINQDGALIGDGLTGSGYALSNAEFGRISGGEINIIAGGYDGAAGDTVIGDLTITGPLAGSNIESNGGGVHFITLSESGTEFDGTLRIDGDVVATGFGADNYLAFYTQNFELNAATGSISITGNGGALAGTLELYASRIHVAEGTLLDRLSLNPQFSGYRQALNQQAAVQRPDGVIRAANFDIEFGGSDSSGPYTLYVQNMGTTTVPAGFLLNAANIGDDGEATLAAGSVDMAINGQIITADGTLTGIAVRDLLVTEFGTTAFVAGSTINGCGLVGPCSAPPPQIDTPARTDVQLTDNSGLGDGLFGNEGDIDDGQEGDAGDRSSPISPPNPLFDSRPLGASDEIDDPVSGAGNPSLYGTSADEDADVEDCDGNTDKKCKTDTKGDGK